jgi:hypothetical protein
MIQNVHVDHINIFQGCTLTSVYVEPEFTKLKRVLSERIRRSEMKHMENIFWLPVQQVREFIDEVYYMTDEGWWTGIDNQIDCSTLKYKFEIMKHGYDFVNSQCSRLWDWSVKFNKGWRITIRAEKLRFDSHTISYLLIQYFETTGNNNNNNTVRSIVWIRPTLSQLFGRERERHWLVFVTGYSDTS